MDRKDYMRDVYSKYWITAREHKYGFLDYDRHLCELITSNAAAGSKLFEVAIGTGYPIADHLAKAGYEIHGIDISPALVQRCRELNPQIDARVGDAEKLDIEDAVFDAAYCFHSTWVIPDVLKTISEMLRVTRPGGLIIFDIQNAANPAMAEAYRQRLAALEATFGTRAKLYARNVAKVVLRRGNPNWHAINYEVPTSPADVYAHLKGLGAKEIRVFARDETDQALLPVDGLSDFSDFPRLVIVAHAAVSAARIPHPRVEDVPAGSGHLIHEQA